MKTLLVLLGAAAAIMFYAPAPSSAQGIGIAVPGVGIQIGEPDRPRYRDYERRRFRHGKCVMAGDAGLSPSSVTTDRCAEFAVATDAN